MSAVQLSESADCARCGEPLGDERRLRTCPHCGAKKAGHCRLCGAAIYLGTDTCRAHAPKAARLFEPEPAAATAGVPLPPPPSVFDVAPPPRRRWTTGRVVAVVGGIVLAGVVGLVVVCVAVVAVFGSRQNAAHREALKSPARPLLQEPCTEYREISFRLARDGVDQAEAMDAIRWVQVNRPVFDRAARVDGSVADAAATVTWLDDLMNDPARLARTTEAEFTSREQPLLDACTKGPGRA